MKLFGLDVHREFTQIAMLERGQLTHLGRIPTTPEALRTFAQAPALWQQVAHRVRLVRHHTRLKNRIHGVLHRNLVPGCPRSDLFGKAGQQWLTTQALPQLPLHEQDIVLATLRQFESLSVELARVDQTLAGLALQHPSVRRLVTIPGIDAVTALRAYPKTCSKLVDCR